MGVAVPEKKLSTRATIPPGAIGDTSVAMTIASGKVVYGDE